MFYFDESIFSLFQKLQRPELDLFLAAPTVFGETVFLMSVAALSILLLDRKRTIEKIGIFCGGILIAHWAQTFLKIFFHRPRPHVYWQDIHVIGPLPLNYAFPSGHTAVAFAGAFLLTAIYGKKAAWTYVVAAWVGITRIYMGTHYPTDVLGGMLIGVLCSDLFYLSIFNLEPNKSALSVVSSPSYSESRSEQLTGSLQE